MAVRKFKSEATHRKCLQIQNIHHFEIRAAVSLDVQQRLHRMIYTFGQRIVNSSELWLWLFNDFEWHDALLSVWLASFFQSADECCFTIFTHKRCKRYLIHSFWSILNWKKINNFGWMHFIFAMNANVHRIRVEMIIRFDKQTEFRIECNPKYTRAFQFTICSSFVLCAVFNIALIINSQPNGTFSIRNKWMNKKSSKKWLQIKIKNRRNWNPPKKNVSEKICDIIETETQIKCIHMHLCVNIPRHRIESIVWNQFVAQSQCIQFNSSHRLTQKQQSLVCRWTQSELYASMSALSTFSFAMHLRFFSKNLLSTIQTLKCFVYTHAAEIVIEFAWVHLCCCEKCIESDIESDYMYYLINMTFLCHWIFGFLTVNRNAKHFIMKYVCWGKTFLLVWRLTLTVIDWFLF